MIFVEPIEEDALESEAWQGTINQLTRITKKEMLVLQKRLNKKTEKLQSVLEKSIKRNSNEVEAVRDEVNSVRGEVSEVNTKVTNIERDMETVKGLLTQVLSKMRNNSQEDMAWFRQDPRMTSSQRSYRK